MAKPVFEIDGEHFTDLQGFFVEISKIVGDGWGKNLNAFNDILYGDMGMPFDEPFVLVWKNSALSRERLGYDATLKLHENGFRNYSRGLSFDEFIRYIRRFNTINRLKRFLRLPSYAEVPIEQAQYGYRYYEEKLALARQHQGETIFDWIMNIFRDHPDVEVRLE